MPPGIGYGNTTEAPQAPQAVATEVDLQQVADSLPPDVWEKVQQHLETLSESEAAEWFKQFATDYAIQGGDAQEAMTRADSLRVKQPGMRGDPRGFQIAASPLEHIGSGMQNYQANKQYKQGREDLAAARAGGTAQGAMGARLKAGMPQATPGINPAGGRAGAIRSISGGPGRGAAPGGPPQGMTPEMIAMLRNR